MSDSEIAQEAGSRSRGGVHVLFSTAVVCLMRIVAVLSICGLCRCGSAWLRVERGKNNHLPDQSRSAFTVRTLLKNYVPTASHATPLSPTASMRQLQTMQGLVRQASVLKREVRRLQASGAATSVGASEALPVLRTWACPLPKPFQKAEKAHRNTSGHLPFVLTTATDEGLRDAADNISIDSCNPGWGTSRKR